MADEKPASIHAYRMVAAAEDEGDPFVVLVLRRDRSGAATDREDSPAENAVQMSAIFNPADPDEADMPESHKVAMELVRVMQERDPLSKLHEEVIPRFPAQEAVVNVCDWLAGHIEGLRGDGEAELAADLTEGLLRPLLMTLDVGHADVTL